MTDEETRIFLNDLRNQILVAIEKAEELAPSETLTTVRRHISHGFAFGVSPSLCISANCTEVTRPDHYQDVRTATWLSPLRQTINTIDRALESLKPVDQALLRLDGVQQRLNAECVVVMESGTGSVVVVEDPEAIQHEH